MRNISRSCNLIKETSQIVIHHYRDPENHLTNLVFDFVCISRLKIPKLDQESLVVQVK